ncbi:MAG: hypothetical protein R2690_09855 [Acidimicrobiales bacterium]
MASHRSRTPQSIDAQPAALDRRTLLLSAGAAVLLAACGGNDAASTPTTAASAAGGTASAADETGARRCRVDDHRACGDRAHRRRLRRARHVPAAAREDGRSVPSRGAARAP